MGACFRRETGLELNDETEHPQGFWVNELTRVKIDQAKTKKKGELGVSGGEKIVYTKTYYLVENKKKREEWLKRGYFRRKTNNPEGTKRIKILEVVKVREEPRIELENEEGLEKVKSHPEITRNVTFEEKDMFGSNINWIEVLDKHDEEDKNIPQNISRTVTYTLEQNPKNSDTGDNWGRSDTTSNWGIFDEESKSSKNKPKKFIIEKQTIVKNVPKSPPREALNKTNKTNKNSENPQEIKKPKEKENKTEISKEPPLSQVNDNKVQNDQEVSKKKDEKKYKVLIRKNKKTTVVKNITETEYIKKFGDKPKLGEKYYKNTDESVLVSFYPSEDEKDTEQVPADSAQTDPNTEKKDNPIFELKRKPKKVDVVESHQDKISKDDGPTMVRTGLLKSRPPRKGEDGEVENKETLNHTADNKISSSEGDKPIDSKPDKNKKYIVIVKKKNNEPIKQEMTEPEYFNRYGEKPQLGEKYYDKLQENVKVEEQIPSIDEKGDKKENERKYKLTRKSNKGEVVEILNSPQYIDTFGDSPQLGEKKYPKLDESVLVEDYNPQNEDNNNRKYKVTRSGKKNQTIQVMTKPEYKNTFGDSPVKGEKYYKNLDEKVLVEDFNENDIEKFPLTIKTKNATLKENMSKLEYWKKYGDSPQKGKKYYPNLEETVIIGDYQSDEDKKDNPKTKLLRVRRLNKKNETVSNMTVPEYQKIFGDAPQTGKKEYPKLGETVTVEEIDPKEEGKRNKENEGVEEIVWTSMVPENISDKSNNQTDKPHHTHKKEETKSSEPSYNEPKQREENTNIQNVSDTKDKDPTKHPQLHQIENKQNNPEIKNNQQLSDIKDKNEKEDDYSPLLGKNNNNLSDTKNKDPIQDKNKAHEQDKYIPQDKMENKLENRIMGPTDTTQENKVNNPENKDHLPHSGTKDKDPSEEFKFIPLVHNKEINPDNKNKIPTDKDTTQENKSPLLENKQYNPEIKDDIPQSNSKEKDPLKDTEFTPLDHNKNNQRLSDSKDKDIPKEILMKNPEIKDDLPQSDSKEKDSHKDTEFIASDHNKNNRRLSDSKDKQNKSPILENKENNPEITSHLPHSETKDKYPPKDTENSPLVQNKEINPETKNNEQLSDEKDKDKEASQNDKFPILENKENTSDNNRNRDKDPILIQNNTDLENKNNQLPTTNDKNIFQGEFSPLQNETENLNQKNNRKLKSRPHKNFNEEYQKNPNKTKEPQIIQNPQNRLKSRKRNPANINNYNTDSENDDFNYEDDLNEKNPKYKTIKRYRYNTRRIPYSEIQNKPIEEKDNYLIWRKNFRPHLISQMKENPQHPKKLRKLLKLYSNSSQSTIKFYYLFTNFYSQHKESTPEEDEEYYFYLYYKNYIHYLITYYLHYFYHILVLDVKNFTPEDVNKFKQFLLENNCHMILQRNSKYNSLLKRCYIFTNEDVVYTKRIIYEYLRKVSNKNRENYYLDRVILTNTYGHLNSEYLDYYSWVNSRFKINFTILRNSLDQFLVTLSNLKITPSNNFESLYSMHENNNDLFNQLFLQNAEILIIVKKLQKRMKMISMIIMLHFCEESSLNLLLAKLILFF